MPVTTWQRSQNLIVAIPFLALAYWGYRQMKRKPRKRSKRKMAGIASRVSPRRKSSKAMRIIRATTVPMRMFADKNGEMKLKAEDWVAEQRKLKDLAKKVR